MDPKASPHRSSGRRTAFHQKPTVGFVEVGTVRGPHGTAGEFEILVASDVPHRFSPGRSLFFGGVLYPIQTSRLQGQRVLVKLRGVNSREHARHFRGLLVEVPESDVPPPKDGSYYHFQIIDMTVHSAEGEMLGQVVEIVDTGVNDVYIVRSEKQEILLPAIQSVILEIDVPNNRMVVELPEGLR